MQKSQAGKKQRENEDQQAIFEMLGEEHRRIQELFQEFEYAADEESKRNVAMMTCTELTAHAQLEEELFYPTVRDGIDEPGLVDEAQVEHGVIKDLITQLEYTEPDDDLYDATFKVLAKYVNHHVNEEETEIFPRIREAGMDLARLRAEMVERRDELRSQHGLGSADDDDDEEEDEDQDQEDEEQQQR